MPFYDHTRSNLVQQRLSPLSNRQLAEEVVQAAKRLSALPKGVTAYPVVQAPADTTRDPLLRAIKKVYNMAVARLATTKKPAFDYETDSDTVAGGLFQISMRIIDNQNNRTDTFLQPIITAVKYMDDIDDARSVAASLCTIKLPAADPEMPVGFWKNDNPFRY